MNPVSVSNSRLQRVFVDLAVSDNDVASKPFADKLGELIGLSNSIVLAESLRGLKRRAFQAESFEAGDAKSAFLQARAEMLAFIVDSFVNEGENVATTSAFILPRPNRDTLDDPEAGFVAYQRFYALHQSEMDHRILTVRRQIQKIMTGRSAKLAQLAALDNIMADTLADYSRRIFASVPHLLAKRFYFLNQQYRQQLQINGDEPALAAHDETARWLKKGAWLDNFILEMQAILLAELELRLMPLVGLVEALDVTSELEVEKQ